MLLLILFLPTFLVGAFMYIYFVIQDMRGESNISATAWHVRLLEYTWESKFTSFTGICNYAWAVFGTITFIQVIYLMRGIAYILQKISDKYEIYKSQYEDYCSTAKEKYQKTIIAKLEQHLLSGLALNPAINRWLQNLIIFNANTDKSITKKRNDLWNIEDNLSPEAILELNRRVAAWEEEEKARKNNPSTFSKSNVNHIAQKAKGMFKILGIVFLVWIGSLLYRLSLYVLDYWARIDWAYTFEVWKEWAIGIGMILAMISVLFIIGIILLLLWKYIGCRVLNYCLPCEVRKDLLKVFFKNLWLGVSYPFKMLGKGVYFLYKVIVAYKENNCTAITWID